VIVSECGKPRLGQVLERAIQKPLVSEFSWGTGWTETHTNSDVDVVCEVVYVREDADYEIDSDALVVVLLIMITSES